MSPSSSSVKKKTTGRRKIEIKRRESKSYRQVTFSKRRTTLFKKAADCCILNGAQIGILTFSPTAGAPFSFAHPSLELILRRYCAEPEFSSQNGDQASRWSHPFPVSDLSSRDMHNANDPAPSEIMKEKKRAKSIERREENNMGLWWKGPIDGLGLEELSEMKRALTELKGNLMNKANSLKAEAESMIKSQMQAGMVNQLPGTLNPVAEAAMDFFRG